MASLLGKATRVAGLALLAGCPMMNFGVPIVMRLFEMDVRSEHAGTATLLWVEAHDLEVRASVVDTIVAAGVLHVVSVCKGVFSS